MLDESCLEKIKRSLPIDIRLNPTTLIICTTTPALPIVTFTVVFLPFLNATVVGANFKKSRLEFMLLFFVPDTVLNGRSKSSPALTS